MQYTIELKYVATITETVEANDEGEALDKARNLAEEADMDDFVIVEELESQMFYMSIFSHHKYTAIFLNYQMF